METNCSACIHWKQKNDLSNQIQCVNDIMLTTNRGVCTNKAMNDSVNLYVNNREYQNSAIDFDTNYWPASWDGQKRGTPSELFMWETTEDFGCILFTVKR